MIKIAPSILSADVLNMERDVQRMLDAGCDWLHVDIMDAHFVPNLSYSPALVKALHQRFDVPLDTHLMMDNPEKYISEYVLAGSYSITIHAEIEGDLRQMLARIREHGCKAGLAIKPATQVEAIRDLLSQCDMIVIMTVEPGFGGQVFQPAQAEKIRQLRALGYTGIIEADGGLNMNNIPKLFDAGLDVAVMGTAMFKSKDPAGDLKQLHLLAKH